MITIWGAGAIGGLAGASMARAGEDVLLVDKVGDHVDAVNRHGLRITGGADFTVPVRASRPEDLRGPLGLTFLAVKSQDTGAALDALAPLAGPATVVVSLQNGMNPPQIADRLGADRVLATFVNYGGDWQGPGHIEHGGPGNVYLGELDGRLTDRLREVERLLSHLHPVHVTTNIVGYLWAKQIYCSLLFAQAVTDYTMADVFGSPQFQPLLAALVAEGVDIAAAAGVRLESFSGYEPLALSAAAGGEPAALAAAFAGLVEHANSQVKVRSGPWRDLAVRGRPTEVDHMTGWLVAEGERRGFDLPLNRRLVAQVKDLEAGRRQRGPHNLAELDQQRSEGRVAAAHPR